MFSLRADGFSWADCVVVFEQLGRFCVPGRSSRRCCSANGADHRPRRADARRPCGSSTSTRSTTCVVLAGAGRAARRPASAIAGEPSTWPLDPLTPVAAVERAAGRRHDQRRRGRAPARGRGAHRRAPARPRRSVHRAGGRVRQGARAVRPADRLVPGDQAPAAPTCSCAPRSRAAAVYAAGAHLDDVDLASYADLDRGDLGRQGAGRRGRDRERQGRDAGVRRHGLHVGGRRAPLPEAGVGARHALRLGRRARRRRRRGRSAPQPDATVRPICMAATADHVLEALAQRLASDPDGPYLDFASSDAEQRAVHRAPDGRGVDAARAHARRRSASVTAIASRRCSTTAPSRSCRSSRR